MESPYSILKSSRRVKILILFVTVILIVFMFPKGESIESEVQINSIWIQDDLIASMPFEYMVFANFILSTDSKVLTTDVSSFF